MISHYVLNSAGEPRVEADFIKWAMWFDSSMEIRRVDFEQVGDAAISTVFLGIDHSYGEEEAPILWETVVFGGSLAGERNRCGGSREQAEAMHAEMVERVCAVHALAE